MAGLGDHGQRRRMVVGITGASGVIFGIRLHELFRDCDIESHIVMSRAAQTTLAYETSFKVSEVEALASFLHLGHIRSLAAVTAAGAIVCPPVPAFYARRQRLSDMIDHALGRVLDLFDIDIGTVRRWTGEKRRGFKEGMKQHCVEAGAI